MNYNIDPNWTFKQTVSNIGALRTQYKGILCSFSYFKLHDKVKAIRDFRNAIYSLNFEEWKKDRIWDCLNGDEVIYILEEIARR